VGRRAVTAVALLCLGVTAWLFLAPEDRRGGRAAPLTTPASTGAPVTLHEASEPAARIPIREQAEPVVATMRALETAAVPVAPPTLAPEASLALLARDEDGEPLAEVELLLEPELGPHEAGLAPALATHPARAARTGESGWALVSDLQPGPWLVRARHATGVARSLSTALAPGKNSLTLELLPVGEALVVRVTAEGEPVPGARVEVTGHWLDLEGRARLVGTEGEPLAAESGPDGRARFSARRLERGFVVARAPDGRVGFWSGGATGEIRLALTAGATLRGQLVGLPPAELADARVLVRLATTHHPHHTTYTRALTIPVAADGTFLLEGLPAGQHGIGLDDPRGARLVLPAQGDGAVPNSVEPLTVELTAGATTGIELRVARGARLEGTVTDEADQPLVGVGVRATLAPRTSNFPDGFDLHGVNVWRFDSNGTLAGDHPETHRTAVSGPDGRWSLPGLHAGRWRLELALDGRAFQRESVTLAEGETRTLAHSLARAGAIEGVDRRGGGFLGVSPEDSAQPFAIAILPHSGGFSFTGLVPGRYTLARFHSDGSTAPVPLATVAVQAGETTWIDLTRAPRPIVIRGRVSAEGLPVAGARVVLWPLEATTDEAGRFQFEEEFEPGRPSFLVEADGVASRFEKSPEGFPAQGYEVELALATQTLGLSLQGADGRPAQGRVTLEPRDIPPFDGLLHVAVQGLHVDGATVVPHLAPGNYLLTAVLDGLRLQREVILPAPEEIVLRAPSAAKLEVEVLGPAGGPLTRGQLAIDVLDHAELGLASRAESRRVEGRVLRFEQVPAGRLAVSLLSSERGWQVRTWASELLTLAPGEVRRITLRASPPVEEPR